MIPLIYALGDDIPTPSAESVLAAVDALGRGFDARVLVRPAACVETSARLTVPVEEYAGLTDFSRRIRAALSAARSLSVIVTEPRAAFATVMLNAFYGRRLNLFLFADEEFAEHRARGLRSFEMRFLAADSGVRRRLIGTGISRERISLAPSFISRERRREIVGRGPFSTDGIRRVAVFATGGGGETLLAEAIGTSPLLRSIDFDLLADGGGGKGLRKYDLLLQLAPWRRPRSEALEALAAGVPLMTAEEEGAPSALSDNLNGFCFRAGDADHLAERLTYAAGLSGVRLNAIAKGGKSLLNARFSAEKCIDRYRRLFSPADMPVVEINGGKLIL